MQLITTAIVGGSGYTGLELTRHVARHPRLRLVAVLSDRWSGQAVADRLPVSGAAAGLRYGALKTAPELDAELVFLATPADVSLALAPRLLARGRRVVDLSGAFRLEDLSAYPRWYGFEHTAPELVAEARYGLPELARAGLAGARFVTNPGCYATAIAMALAPLLRAGLGSADGVVVAAMSGVSGAGRKSSEEYSFCEVDEDLRAYRLGKHQHVPEIEQTVARFAGKCGPISFTPHHVPIRRGILATCTLRLTPGAGAAEVQRAYEEAYAGEPFVRVLPPDRVAVKDVARTNRVHLGAAADARSGALVAVSAIDNLVKGAAGQAIQALNAAMGWEEPLGLDLLGG
jgi:N-acetyl-gamma-glutamyl-phosphate reductase